MGPLIDLTTLFPYRIILLLSESFAFYNVIHSICKDKIHPLVTWVAILFVRIVTSQIFFNASTSMQTFGLITFIIGTFIVILFLCSSKFFQKVLAFFFIVITKFISAFAMALLDTTVYQGKNYVDVFGTENLNLDFLYMFLTECIVIISISFLASGILKLFNTRNSKSKNKKLYAYFTFIPFSHIFVILLALVIAPRDFENTPDFGFAVNFITFLIMVLIMLFDFSFPFVIDHFEKLDKKNTENEKMLLQNKLDYQQMLMLTEEKQEFRKIKHDYANLLATARGFIEIGKPEKALAILQDTNDDLSSLANFSLCSNETINTIVYIKQQKANKLGISLDVKIYENYPVKVNDYDLCRLLNNIIDNSLNAVEKLNDNKLSLIDITVDDDKIIIKSKNKFTSNKPNKSEKSSEHGNGIGIIKEIVKKYTGKYTSRQENDVWYTEATFYNEGNKK
jgi:multisubunit Na+/H+ antiporter MnhG subunit